MSRLFTADVHAVLDRLEEPDVLLKHAIREMEEELARGEQRLRALAEEREALDERQRKAQAGLVELAAQLDVCFANDNEELARKVIKRRLEVELHERRVIERRAAVDRELKAEKTTTVEQREQLDVMRQKADLLATTTPAGDDDWSRADCAVGDADVEVAFLRERAKRRPS
jgi:phage shock protein A